jgi:hypothetical protein
MRPTPIARSLGGVQHDAGGGTTEEVVLSGKCSSGLCLGGAHTWHPVRRNSEGLPPVFSCKTVKPVPWTSALARHECVSRRQDTPLAHTRHDSRRYATPLHPPRAPLPASSQIFSQYGIRRFLPLTLREGARHRSHKPTPSKIGDRCTRRPHPRRCAAQMPPTASNRTRLCCQRADTTHRLFRSHDCSTYTSDPPG